MSKGFEIFKMTSKLVLPFMNIIVFLVWKNRCKRVEDNDDKAKNIKLLKNIKILT